MGNNSTLRGHAAPRAGEMAEDMRYLRGRKKGEGHEITMGQEEGRGTRDT